jgi:tRNA pseudouridine55 synthase
LGFDFYSGELLLVDKPMHWTSFQAVNKIKHAVKRHPSMVVNGQRVKAKVGHAGTLDPLATGLLLVCTGKRTKTIDELMGLEKEYTGTFFLGATTPCFDLEKPVDATYPIDHITGAMVVEAARRFTGTLEQVPPSFSAVMVEGRRAYDLARAGEETTLKPRKITVTEFEILRVEKPLVDFRIACSKGTYIRSIARDFGLALGSGAHLVALRRTRIGKYTVDQADGPETIAAVINNDRLDDAPEST